MNELADSTLLQSWQEHRDALAFKELTLRYGGLVYSAANRVLANSADAEDVAQECFVKLATAAPEPKRSLAAWLHTVAVRGAIDRVRGEARRRDREAAWEAERPRDTDLNLDDLLHHVDEAIAALPPAQRECIVRHFLHGIGPVKLAAELGVSRSTVQRRINEGVARVREGLARKGITVTVGALTAALDGLECGAAPPALAATLGKIAVAGRVDAGVAAGQGIKLAGGVIVMKKAVGFGMGLVVLALAAWWHFGGTPSEPLAKAGDRPAPLETVSRPPDAAPTPGNEPAPEAPLSADDSASVAEEVKMTTLAAFDVSGKSGYAPDRINNPTKYASLAGLVTDERGTPVPDADIQVLVHRPDTLSAQQDGRAAFASYQAALGELWNDARYRFDTSTNGQGAFAIDAIPYSGSALVVASAPYHERNLAACALEAEQTADVAVTLQNARAIHGEVVTEGGLPVAGATVDAKGQFYEDGVRGMGTTPEYIRSRTDTQGYFTLWLGNYDIDGDVQTAVHVKSAEQGEALFFPVDVGLEERIKLTLKSEWAELSGRIDTSDREPAAGYRIVLEGSVNLSMNGASLGGGSGHEHEATTDAEGRYGFEKLAAFADYTAKVLDPQGQVAARTPLPKLAAGEANVWNYTLGTPIHVRGEVLGLETGKPLGGVIVNYALEGKDDPAGPVSDQTHTDAAGAFKFTVVSGAGAYRFVARYQGNAVSGDTESSAKSVDLEPGGDAFVSLELSEPGTRSFIIQDAAGQPLEGVEASVSLQYENSRLGTWREEKTDGAGFVEFGQLDPNAESEFVFQKEGFINGVSERVACRPGEALPVEYLVLYRAASLAARLVDSEGGPIANAPVTCVARYAEGRSTSVDAATDADGWILLDRNLPGTTADLEFRVGAADGSAIEPPLSGLIEQAELAPDRENDLGEVALAPEIDAVLEP